MTVEELKVAAEQTGQALPPGVIAALETAERREHGILEMNFAPEARVAKWKDHAAQTARDVAAALDRAIESDDVLSRLRSERERIVTGAQGEELELGEQAFLGTPGDSPELRRHIDAKVRMRAGVLTPVAVMTAVALSDPANLLLHFRETALAGSPSATRAVGLVVGEKLNDLARGQRPGAAQALSAFRAAWAAWERTHPSPVAQIDEINNRLIAREDQIRRGVLWAVKATGGAKPHLVGA